MEALFPVLPQSTFNNFNGTFRLAIWDLMVGADQFVLNTILPIKFSKLQASEAWAIVSDKVIWKVVRG